MRLRLVTGCCALLSLSGCFSYAQYNGYPYSNVRLWSNVEKGNSKEGVIKTLGYPVIEEGNSWIYPSCILTRIAASTMHKYSCEVLKVSFDESDSVSAVARFAVPKRSLQSLTGSRTKVTGISDGVWRKIEGIFSK